MKPSRETPLPAYHIRLLQINADEADPHAGQLVTVPLEEAPPYYALSHCWGRHSQPVPIQLREAPLPVQPDLHAAIQQLRTTAALATESTALDPPLKFIWIDSICVKQDDAQELSAQVQLMDAIYSRAVRTLIWLGPEYCWSSAAWRLVDDIYDLFRAESPTARTLEDIPQAIYSDAAHAKSTLPPWDSLAWSSLKRLFDLRWFRRVWVVQEVVHSQRDPLIIHGNTLRSWHRLGWAASWLRRKGYTRLPQVSQATLNVDMMCIIRRSRAPWPLDALLSITQVKFHASDQRDKIWSLLGLAAECHPSGLRAPRNICSSVAMPVELRPDYSLSTTEVYRRVGGYLLERSATTALLTRARGLVDSPSRKRRKLVLSGLPSWAPDWSDFAGYNRGIRTSFSWVHCPSGHQKQPAALGYPRNYAASGRSKLTIHHHPHEKAFDASDAAAGPRGESVLCVGGVVVDSIERVASLSESPMWRDQFHASFDSAMVLILQAALITLSRDMEPDEEKWPRADERRQIVHSWVAKLVKATTADQHHANSLAWESCLRDGMLYLRDLVLRHREDILSCPWLPPDSSSGHAALDMLENELPRLEDANSPHPEGAYISLARHFCFNRTFFITHQGRMGIGPSAAQKGDMVAVISGGGVPFILRSQPSPQSQEIYGPGDSGKSFHEPSGPCWQVVGESYVHGIMHGEALETGRHGDVEQATLTLI